MKRFKRKRLFFAYSDLPEIHPSRRPVETVTARAGGSKRIGGCDAAAELGLRTNTWIGYVGGDGRTSDHIILA